MNRAIVFRGPLQPVSVRHDIISCHCFRIGKALETWSEQSTADPPASRGDPVREWGSCGHFQGCELSQQLKLVTKVCRQGQKAGQRCPDRGDYCLCHHVEQVLHLTQRMCRGSWTKAKVSYRRLALPRDVPICCRLASTDYNALAKRDQCRLGASGLVGEAVWVDGTCPRCLNSHSQAR